MVGDIERNQHLCLLNLSEGGKDAVFVREFDAVAKTFVTNGFELPEGEHLVRFRERLSALELLHNEGIAPFS
ncbi:hypothetical protein [Bradyrhizobium sp. LMG 9283]|uniref:hypothetical protein n=1 Tax=Bradyrhizobium sp. LMG 9283 TaxID=592064 RepID=UPI0038904BE6